MKKKWISMLLCMAMTAAALAGCGDSGSADSGSAGSEAADSGTADSGSQTAEEPAGEVETINVTYFSVNSIDDTAMVEEAVNKISEEKIGVRVKLNAMEGGQYMSQQTMLLSGSEDIDLIVTPLVTDAMNSGAFADMTDLVEEYGQDIKAVLGDNLEAGKYRGCLYGLPNLHEYASTPLLVYNGDIANELGLDMASVKKLEDLDGILAKVVEAYPDMSTPLYTGSSSGCLSSSYHDWDTLGDNLGVVMFDGASDKVVNLYETEKYRELVTTLHDFSQKGYLNADSAVLTENYWSLVPEKMSFGCILNQHELIAEEYTPSTGVNLEIVPLAETYRTTSNVTTFLWRIMSTSKKQVSAMKFLNLLYSDAEVEDLICNGIEGVHYQVTEDGKYTYPDGVDFANSTYYPNIGWVMPNGWLAGEWVGDIENYGEKMTEYNESAKASPAYGFIFDSSNVANEVTACTNVVQQYCNSVEENGTVDVDSAIADLNKALKEAGIDTVIAEKQKQYDEFLSNQ